MNPTLDLAKVALLAGGGWAVTTLLRRTAATARHDLWLLVILGVMLVPAAELLLPPLYIIVPPTWESLEQRPERWLPMIGVWGVWAVGALVWVARLVPGLVALRQVARQGERWSAPGAVAALAEAARLAGVTRPVTLLRSSAVQVPATWGVRRPIVALPAAAASWTPERLRLVLVRSIQPCGSRPLGCGSSASAPVTRPYSRRARGRPTTASIWSKSCARRRAAGTARW